VRGDFSRWQFQAHDNFNGILPQQGKLLIDADGLAQTRIVNYWQQVAAHDWVGPVAAVPADEPNSFQVTGAVINPDGTVTLTVGSGRIWGDGMLVRLGGDNPTVQRAATWLEPPIVPTQGSAATVAGAQDVVVLEIWQEGINGYQMPNTLIEPALGGPDTAERLHTGTAFRLARLTPGQNCKSVTFNDSGLGKLTATLQPVTVIAGDCPIPVGGGYSGFEHRLYRLEIADLPPGSPTKFKWSRQNGGLVGRGTFTPGPNPTLAITANLVAITTANQASFYVEFEQWDAARGDWQVVCGATASLNADTLTFTNTVTFGSYPAQGNYFIRLWDGLEAISDFPIEANPNQLELGIFLQFDPDAPGLYRSRDYWTFAVRAAGIANPQTLIDHKPPEGIVYHRVPLAEITWNAAGNVLTIDDCRATITPLTSPRGCCSVQVGDGLTTFAPFTSIQAAIDSLPAGGGEVCILAGRYFEAISIASRNNVSIHGCGSHTRIASPSLGPNKGANSGAVLTILNSQDIELHSFVVEAADGDIGIELAGTAAVAVNTRLADLRRVKHGVTDVTMRELIVIASTVPAVSVEQSRVVRLEDSLIAMRDVLSKSAAVFVSGQEIHVSRNWVGPLTTAIIPAIVAADLASTSSIGAAAFTTTVPMAKAPCGIQIAGISRDIYLRYNEIEGGSGNGITLGGIILVDSKTGIQINGYIGYNPTGGTQDPCSNGNFYYPGRVTVGGQTGNVVVDGRLTDIHIENNRIRNMGLCGIGPIGFFNLKDTQEVVTVNGLWIVANEINSCLRRTLTRFTAADAVSIGYGGICLPDVTQAFIRDNIILDTGASLADPVSGIFILHGAQVEISRNQIQDTRDWSKADPNTFTGYRSGISLVMVTPLDAGAATSSAWTVSTMKIFNRQSLYQHGAPALCIQENVVDIPLGLALVVAGLGAFSILGNHFSTGGARGEITLARSVLIFNFGTPVEYPLPVAAAAEFLALLEALNAGATSSQAFQTVLGSSATIVGAIAPGPVNFSENRCSLHETFEAPRATSSIWITTFDDLGFHDNQCWLASSGLEVSCDAFLLGATVRVTGCRFQEIPQTVYLSALTFGLMNITSLNEATHPLAPLGPPALSVTTGNVVA
jgi:hypothetical protein